MMPEGHRAGRGQLQRHVQHCRHVGPHGQVDHQVGPQIWRRRHDEGDEEAPEEDEEGGAVQQVWDADRLSLLPLKGGGDTGSVSVSLLLPLKGAGWDIQGESRCHCFCH